MRPLLPLSLLTLLQLTTALYTPKGSSCSVECGTKAQNFTGTSDLVCLDTAYTDTSNGQLYKSCIDCLGNSTYYNATSSFNGNSDQWWFLWHLKYIQQYCLIDTPQTSAASTCQSQCSGLQPVLDTSWIYEGAQPQYGYCGWNSSAYKTYAGGCAECLEEQEGGVVIGNAMRTLLSACDVEPMVQDGNMVIVQGDLFASAVVTGTTTPQTSSNSAASATGASSQNAATTTDGSKGTDGATAAPTTTAATPSSATASSSGLSAAAGAGIGVGIALVAVAAIAGAVFLWLRRKKRSAAPRMPDAPPQYLASELGEQAHRPELASGEKVSHKVVEVEAKSSRFPVQELDASGGR